MSKLRTRIYSMLPCSLTLLERLIDEPEPGMLAATLTDMLKAKTIDIRPCSLTGKPFVVDRREHPRYTMPKMRRAS